MGSGRRGFRGQSRVKAPPDPEPADDSARPRFTLNRVFFLGLGGLGAAVLAWEWRFLAAVSSALPGPEARTVAERLLGGTVLLFALAAAVGGGWIQLAVRRSLRRLAAASRDPAHVLQWRAPLREAAEVNRAVAEYAEALRRHYAGVREEYARLTLVLNRLEEGLVLLSAEGRVLADNPAARKLLSTEAAEESWEGRILREVVSHAGLAEFIAQLDSPMRPPFFQIDRGAGAPLDLLCHLRTLGGDAGAYLFTVINITDFRNLDRAKSDFVANASHELKTPLSSIRGYAESLLDGALENSQTREPFVRKIYENSLRLQRLVQDLLSLSQLESQTSPRHSERLPVRTYVHAAAQLLRTEMEGQGIRFENQVPAGLCLRMEPRDLELICNNLVGNAVRYNQPGGKVRVYWDSGTRRVAVKDTGIGIAEELLPRIFERFYRADGSRARKDGTGLGLAIVKHAAQRYGMTVRAHSRPGEGSEFSVEVPADLVG